MGEKEDIERGVWNQPELDREIDEFFPDSNVLANRQGITDLASKCSCGCRKFVELPQEGFKKSCLKCGEIRD